ncbi:MAG TPA: FAD-dependent monooxygenase [Amycolatopsis sp.]|nr:FAD-dependent monooxygenase [Amycolatopsis sp.]
MVSSSSPMTCEPQVVIAGGGPIGMFLAAELGSRGVRTLVVERSREASTQAKVMQISFRTMEFCRRLGIAGEVEHWGFEPGYPMTNVFVTALGGYELGRKAGEPVGYPGSPGHTEHSPQYQVHCPQPWLEPVVEHRARSYPSVEILRGWSFESFTETADGVTARITEIDSGAEHEVHAEFLVGCEGFGGKIVRQLGIPVTERTIDYSLDIEFTTADLVREHDKGPAVRYTLVGPGGTWGTVVAVDGRYRWRLSVYDLDPDRVDELDSRELVERAVGHPFDFEVIRRGRWKRRAAMAASFGRGRVFLAGDSAHCSPPNGGFGMNTGIADVMNLGWKIEAVLHGWAGPDLLDTYTVERRPIAQVTLAESVTDYGRLMDDTAYPDVLEPGAAHDERRREIGAELVERSVRAWWPIGIHIGYGYSSSPIVCGVPGEWLTFDPYHYQPSTTPGFRAPHVWLEDGRSTLDLFGPSHVLLRIGEGADGESLVDSAAAAGMPLAVHDLSGPDVTKFYDRHLVLVRPDGFIAWSGDEPPVDAGPVISTVRGDLGPRRS